jgi:very-short-patch-repair endonuclease
MPAVKAGRGIWIDIQTFNIKCYDLFMRTKVYNKSSVKENRRAQRKNLLLPEVLLWLKLKNHKVRGIKFRRQYSIGKYIVDFYAPELRLAIEVDGKHHFNDKDMEIYDDNRQKFIEMYDIKFLRFNASSILGNMNGVLLKIEDEIDKIGK